MNCKSNGANLAFEGEDEHEHEHEDEDHNPP